MNLEKIKGVIIQGCGDMKIFYKFSQRVIFIYYVEDMKMSPCSILVTIKQTDKLKKSLTWAASILPLEPWDSGSDGRWDWDRPIFSSLWSFLSSASKPPPPSQICTVTIPFLWGKLWVCWGPVLAVDKESLPPLQTHAPGLLHSEVSTSPPPGGQGREGAADPAKKEVAPWRSLDHCSGYQTIPWPLSLVYNCSLFCFSGWEGNRVVT